MIRATFQGISPTALPPDRCSNCKCGPGCQSWNENPYDYTYAHDFTYYWNY